MENTKKAIDRLSWRFKNFDTFNVKDQDKTAMNLLIEFFNQQSGLIQRSQDPFAKMYLFLYLNLLRKRDLHGTDVMPARILSDILNAPKSHLIAEISEHVDSINLQEYFKKHISCDKIQREMNDQEFTKHQEEVKKIPVDDFIKFQKSQTSENEISMKLISHINQILDNYKAD